MGVRAGKKVKKVECFFCKEGKEGWVLTNWCFWIVVLEKPLESPLDCKEIKPINPKGNQPWIFMGRTDAEAEALILWPPVWRANSLENILMLGKIDGKRRRGWQRIRQFDIITDSININLSKLQEKVGNREVCYSPCGCRVTLRLNNNNGD